MEVLNLVTAGDASFFEQQVESLESRGVTQTTLSVGLRSDSDRSPADYVRFYLRTLAAARREYDLVHVHYGLLAPLALAQPIRPVVMTLWGSDVMADDWVTDVSRAAANHVDAVILPSSAMSPYLSNPYDLIPFGIDLDRFSPRPRVEARRRVGWDPEDRIVLFPNSPERTIKNYPRARAIVDRLSVSAELRWITGVPYEEMPDYLNASDAVLVTSRREAGPMVVKEAAACNVPVFSTDVGFAGQVLDPVNRSAVCHTDAEFVLGLEAVLSSRRRSNGRETLADAGLDEMADRLLGVYRRVLDTDS